MNFFLVYFLCYHRIPYQFFLIHDHKIIKGTVYRRSALFTYNTVCKGGIDLVYLARERVKACYATEPTDISTHRNFITLTMEIVQ